VNVRPKNLTGVSVVIATTPGRTLATTGMKSTPPLPWAMAAVDAVLGADGFVEPG
jgi:hypothetical protein